MKKYLVIGNPIDHSMSPELHNFWLKKKLKDCTPYSFLLKYLFVTKSTLHRHK